MKKIVASVTIFLMTGIISLMAQTQISNGGFETWTSNFKPASWHVVDTLGIHSCYKTTDVHTGGSTFAARLRSLDTTILIIYHEKVPGLATLGRINTSTGTIDKGVPFTDKPDFFRGYFKYIPVNTDTMTAGVYFWHYNAVLHKQDTLGGVLFDTSATINSYVQFNLPIAWDTNYTFSPDSMNIILLASNTVQNHTAAYFDDLSFYYVTVGLETSLNEVLNGVYPNPARGILNIGNEENTNISLYSLTGNLILNSFSAERNARFDVTALPRGIYILKLQNETGILTSKVVLE